MNNNKKKISDEGRKNDLVNVVISGSTDKGVQGPQVHLWGTDMKFRLK
jgi:hypothetical protein